MDLPENSLSSLSIKSDSIESAVPLPLTQTSSVGSTGVIHDKPITDLALKTPISFLQEINLFHMFSFFYLSLFV